MTPVDTAEERKTSCPQGGRIAVLETSLHEKMNVLMGDTKEIKECLFGNGKPGLRLTVDRLDQWRELHSEIGNGRKIVPVA